MMIRTGYRAMAQYSEQRQASGGDGDYIREIMLRDDGDAVRFRLVTDYEVEYAEASGVPFVVIEGEFHFLNRTSKNGKAYSEDILCTLVLNPDSEQWEGQCEHCDTETRRRSQFLMWAWVYAIYHKFQNPKYQVGNADTDKYKWTPVKLGNAPMFREDVQKYCIWKDGYYMRQMVEAKIARFGTLCDRDYMVTRHGVRGNQQTRRLLEDLPESPMAQEIKDGAVGLPSLEDYATRKVRTYGGQPKTEETPAEVDFESLQDELATIESPISGFGPAAGQGPEIELGPVETPDEDKTFEELFPPHDEPQPANTHSLDDLPF